MKESRILKLCSYLLIPILILIISLTAIYETKKDSIKYVNNYFNSNEFVKYYIQQLKNDIEDVDAPYFHIVDSDNKNIMIHYRKYKRTKMKNHYYIIIYNNNAYTNVEPTEETNSIKEIVNYIQNNENSKYVNILDGKLESNSEVINKNAIRYLENAIYETYTYSGSKDNEEKNKIYEEVDIGKYKIVTEVSDTVKMYFSNTKLYSSYKEELNLSNTQTLIMKLSKDLSFLDEYSYIFIPISCITLLGIIIYLIISIGHEKKKENVILNDFDKVPIEILFFSVLFICLIIQSTIVQWLYKLDFEFLLSVLITIYFVMYIIIAIFINTLIKRIKSKTFLNTSILFKLFKYLKKYLVKVIRIINKSRKRSIILIISSILYVFFIIELYLSLNVIGVIISILITLGICISKLIKLASLKKIEKHLKNLYEGNLSDKLDVETFRGEYRDIALYINNISSSFESVMQKEIKNERFKTELITNVSHDIKTPLTSIINYIDLLKKENINNDKVSEYINILDVKSQRLKKLTEDLVEASKASSGNIKLNMEKINIDELMNQAIGEFKDRFNKEGLEIIKSVSSKEINIIADSRYMYRIIENLFVNITKYAVRDSRVYIDILSDKENVKIEIKNVSNEKLNISADELMQRFVRGDKSRTTDGSGLRIIYIKESYRTSRGYI